MAEQLHYYDFPEAKEGNSYYRVRFKFAQEDVYYLPGAKVYMQLRRKPGQLVVAELSTENGKLEISGNYWLDFLNQIINLPSGIYYYDILFVFPDGRRRTYIEGKFPVKAVITTKKIV